MVKKLISKHPEHINARGGHFGTALHAASRENHVEVAQSLLEHGADINARGQLEWTSLHVPSRYRRVEIGRWLLEHGADMNARKNNHWTPLHLVASNGCLELVGTLSGMVRIVPLRTTKGIPRCTERQKTDTSISHGYC